MEASQALWSKFRAAQQANNADAANAFKKAIELANKGKDASWWEKQGDMALYIDQPVQV